MSRYVRDAVACGLGIAIGLAGGYGIAHRPVGGQPSPPLAQPGATIAVDHNIVYVLRGDTVYTYVPSGGESRADAVVDPGGGLRLVGTTRLDNRR
jgi:hypothetical protein